MAGLWESWKNDGEVIESCTIITTTANALMESLHDRMPVILSPDDYAAWLDSDITDKPALQKLLHPCDANWLEAYPVRPLVGNPRNDVPECIERL